MRKMAVVLAGLLMAAPTVGRAQQSTLTEATYKRLDTIREDKRQQLLAYLERIKSQAQAVARDEVMLEFFQLKNRYYQLKKSTPPPAELESMIERLKLSLREHYLRHYLSFHDILFVNEAGDVFHTIRREGDYHKNLFEGEMAQTTLATQLLHQPQARFVDYEYYFVSDEPSAFLVEPVIHEGVLAGWFVLQCAIRKINSMFIEAEGLGSTGEVFLVNREQFLLTESRFSKEASILNLHLSRENIESKFREHSGHKIVTDYRGHRALSSFEVFRMDNSEWLLIAKIDEAEVITEQYRQNRTALRAALAARLGRQERPPAPAVNTDSNLAVVDIDEFRKASDNELLCTYGVSTCTSIIVTFPQRFAYLGHISNLDVVYGGNSTDLVRHMFKRIDMFDVYPYERHRLQVAVIANHGESIINIIDRLVADGVLLSQIRFVTADARYANVFHDYRSHQTLIEWAVDGAGGQVLRQGVAGIPSVGEMVKALIEYE